MITHVEPGRDYAKVHRLLVPVATLTQAHGARLACGRTFKIAAHATGFNNYPEKRDSWMCAQCRQAH